ncbi:MAG TPA: M1 family metallopeptidase [Gaiellaceae bacterium]|nr:M1 family metallopeptidase [Gaiellaceae bacterium]
MQETRLSRVGLLFVLAALALTALAGTASATRYTAGAPGLGDPFFPNAGNGGYDVQSYDLDLDYTPATRALLGTAFITATATQDLDAFNLDLRKLDEAGHFYTVSRVAVGKDNGPALEDMAFSHEGQELTIHPRPKLKRGESFVVLVEYAGTAHEVTDPDESIEGFVPTDDGAFVVSEPQGSPGWYPANDYPTDKALFDISITVPEGITALGNGVLVSSETKDGKTTWNWSHGMPMAPYLATATNGVFDLTVTELPGGIPSYVAVDPRRTNTAVLAHIPAMMTFFSDTYGPYPFDATGAIVDVAPHVGYALETQTKANYSNTPGESTLAHEIAHEWFGNAVTLSSWPDIWLNEGFARVSEWLWLEHRGIRTAQQSFDIQYARAATSSFWQVPPATLPGPVFLFQGANYDRGAMTLHALRGKIGDMAFFQLLRDWYADNKYGNVSTADFIEAAEEASGMELDSFFDVWLFQPGKPTSW